MGSKEQKQVGGKYESSSALLQAAGLRPTRQRLALADWLFDGSCKHVTAEQVHAAIARTSAHVSLATVYNTLNNFTSMGLLRSVAVGGGQTYFDTYTIEHHHIFDEKTGALFDIPPGDLRIVQLPPLPQGTVLSRVDVVLRVSSGS